MFASSSLLQRSFHLALFPMGSSEICIFHENLEELECLDFLVVRHFSEPFPVETGVEQETDNSRKQK